MVLSILVMNVLSTFGVVMVKTLRVEWSYEVLESYLQCSSSQNIRKWVTHLFPTAFDMKLVALIPTCIIEWKLTLRETRVRHNISVADTCRMRQVGRCWVRHVS